MKKMVKKNQIIITALAVMVAIAGYFSFTSKEVSIIDEDGNTVELSQNKTEEAQETMQAATETEGETIAANEGAAGNQDDAEVSAPVDDTIGEAVLTNAGAVSVTSDAIVNAKLNREQTRSKSQAMLMELVNNESLDAETKQKAVDELVAMTAVMEKESICEQQLLAKGFEETVVLISDGCVDVTVNRSELTEIEKAQIEDIITRKAGCDVSEIIINTVD